jgi:hypothetical protein
MNRQVETQVDPSPINLPTGLPFVKGESNRSVLRAIGKAAGIKLDWPCNTQAALILADLAGYAADRSALDYCLLRGYCPKPRKDSKQYQYVWNESDVVAFLDALESLRRFKPLHPCHVHKLTPSELAAHHVEHAKLASAASAFNAMSENELVNLLAASEDAEQRKMLAAALKKKLGILDVRGNESATAYEPAMN